MKSYRLQVIISIVCGFISASVIYVITRMLSLALLTFAALTMSILALLPSLFLRKSIKEKCALKEFESFLTLFAEELKRGNSPELAYKNALSHYNGPIWYQLVEVYKKVISGVPIASALRSMEHSANLRKHSPLLFMISKLIETNSNRAGEHIAQAVLRFRENRRLLEEREHLAMSLSFKIKVLTVACSASSAILLAMLPLFSTFFIVRSIVTASLTFNVHWLLASAISVTSGVSAYYAGIISLAESPHLYFIASLIVFWIVFLTATSCLSLLFLY